MSIAVHVKDVACFTPSLRIVTAKLTTDAGGSGRADVRLTPEDAAGLRDASHEAI